MHSLAAGTVGVGEEHGGSRLAKMRQYSVQRTER